MEFIRISINIGLQVSQLKDILYKNAMSKLEAKTQSAY